MNTSNTTSENRVFFQNLSGCWPFGTTDDGNTTNSVPSSSSSGSLELNCEELDLQTAAKDDVIAAKLATAGPIGVAAAAAIVSTSSKNIKKSYSFETNPTIRKRQQTRLLKKLRQTVNELTTRVGQQAVVLIAIPGVQNTDYNVFGAKPLENVVKKLRSTVMQDLQIALEKQTQDPVETDPALFELPPLIIDGIPIAVEKMTQAQLRTFIPLMLKFSTGRGKPGWGRALSKPIWWPKAVPWANVRMDSRSEEQKKLISWTHALRQIVINCYKFHGREDLLLSFCNDIKEKTGQQRILNSDGTLTVVDPTNPVDTLPNGTTANWQYDESNLAVQMTNETNSQCEYIELKSTTEAKFNQATQYFLTSEDGLSYSVSLGHVVNTPSNIQDIYEYIGSDVAGSDTTSNTSEPVLVQVSGDDPSQPRLVEVYSLKDALLCTNAMYNDNTILMTNEATPAIMVKNEFL